jgi:peptide/nickel transport system substrate-binding protein
VKKLTFGLIIMAAISIVLVACAAEEPKIVEVVKEVVVTKEVIKEVPVEKIVTVEKEVVKEVKVPGETVILEKVVIKEVPGEAVIVEKVVIKEVPVEVVVTKEVIKEVPVEVIVIKEVIKTVEVSAAVPIKYSESPMLAQLVAGGKLPPVEQRIPDEPLVVPVIREIGKYGGILHTATNNSLAWISRYLPQGLVRASADGQSLLPHVAKSWEASDDFKTWTFYLRSGTRWSDGVPYTADDCLWWYNEVNMNAILRPNQVGFMRVGDGFAVMKKVDDYTISFELPYAAPMFVWGFVGNRNPCVPAHFMKQFHEDFNSNIEKDIKDAQFDNWRAYYFANAGRQFNELPSLRPWLIQNEMEDQIIRLIRNPYYYAVDSEGNQLPYIDQLEWLQTDVGLVALKVIAGDVDLQISYGVSIGDMPLLKENEDKGGYDLKMWTQGFASDATLYINQGYIGPGKEYWLDKKFRQALSISINREAIIEASYVGLGEGRQVAPVRGHPMYPGDKYVYAYTQYDLEEANKLLDLIMPNKDSDGWRLMADGNRMEFPVFSWGSYGAIQEVAQQITADFNAVGLKASYDTSGRGFGDEYKKGEIPVTVYVVPADYPLLNPRYTIPIDASSLPGPQVGLYVATGGKEGVKPTPYYQELIDLHLIVGTAATEVEQAEIGKEIFRRYSENLWSIGIVGGTPQPIVISRKLGNVPDVAFYSYATRSPSNAFIEQWYFK